ncbi:primosomal protein N' [Candidatus Dependentiae bacterium]|nr:MAG: primosomal protein N' [Candidatus Dependentiae bacterium]
MYIHVKLLNGFPKVLLYKIPDNWNENIHANMIVQVPLRTHIVPALIVKTYQEKPNNCSFTIKNVRSIEPFPDDAYYYSFITQLSNYYQVEQIHFLKRIRSFIHNQKKREEILLPSYEDIKESPVILTAEQRIVCDFLIPRIKHQNYMPVLLHGVTSSGKTEIYKKLINETILNQKTAVILTPEVSLALQLENILKQQISSHILMSSFHSATSHKDKRRVWELLLQKKPFVLLGVHLPVLLPIPNLGLIIVDEEHETGYQEKKHPKINSKDAALLRASIAKIPIVLGSATPSLSSLYNVKQRRWHFFQLKNRFAGSFPIIKIVSMKKNQQRKSFWITRELQYAIQNRLNKKEQTIIFLNRRGYSFFVQCSSCSFIFSCKACSVSLTLHQNNTLACHYCGFAIQLPDSCPQCTASEKKLLKKGIGTQQVVSILSQLFPSSRIGRADFDVSSKKKIWQQTVRDFESGKIDILVGTQTIAKGFHFPNVTLVGILWADLNLHFPIYNATEKTLQQLIQVAGRAGRQSIESTVIVQTMTYYPIFAYLNEIDYLAFYAHELENRKELCYPPYYRLAEVEFKHPDEQVVDIESVQFSALLKDLIEEQRLTVTILGPAKPPVYKIKRMHIRKLYLKGSTISQILELYKQGIKSISYKSSIFFTPNPLC